MITAVQYDNNDNAIILEIKGLPLMSNYEEVMIDVDGNIMSAAKWANNPNNNTLQVKVCLSPNEAGYSDESISCLKLIPSNDVNTIKVWSRINIAEMPGPASLPLTVYKGGAYQSVGAGQLTLSNLGYVIAYIMLLIGLIYGLLYMAQKQYVYGMYVILVTWMILLIGGMNNGYMTWLADVVDGIIEYKIYRNYQVGRVSYTFR
ncbi:MAG: hypothetical protein [aquatic viral metagenome]